MRPNSDDNIVVRRTRFQTKKPQIYMHAHTYTVNSSAFMIQTEIKVDSAF